jgi:hypothetical protein
MDASLSNLILTGHQKKNCAQLLKQKLTISEILREYGKKFTHRLKSDILMDITEDVLSVSSCHITAGMVKTILRLLENC